MLLCFFTGEDASDKNAFEEQVKQLEKLKEERLKTLKNEEGKTTRAAHHELLTLLHYNSFINVQMRKNSE